MRDAPSRGNPALACGHPLRCAVIATALAASLVAPLRAEPPVEGDERGGRFASPSTAIRIALSGVLPLGDLANENPRDGWVGGQGPGIAGAAGVRLPLMQEVFVRPEFALYSLGEHRNRDVPVIVIGPSGSEPDTVSGDWTRSTLMTGLRVHLDYVPSDRGFVSPFLAGGFGLIYMRVHDVVLLDGFEDIDQTEDTLGLSASIGVGLLVGNAELVLAGTFQEPGFTDFGSVSWFTADLSVAYALGIP